MGKHNAPVLCPVHKPVQHRDGKPPWCPVCGLDATGRVPVSTIGKRKRDQ
jgi:hypothetical protein